VGACLSKLGGAKTAHAIARPQDVSVEYQHRYSAHYQPLGDRLTVYFGVALGYDRARPTLRSYSAIQHAGELAIAVSANTRAHVLAVRCARVACDIASMYRDRGLGKRH
jgi:hypothetical protein